MRETSSHPSDHTIEVPTGHYTPTETVAPPSVSLASSEITAVDPEVARPETPSSGYDGMILPLKPDDIKTESDAWLTEVNEHLNAADSSDAPPAAEQEPRRPSMQTTLEDVEMPEGLQDKSYANEAPHKPDQPPKTASGQERTSEQQDPASLKINSTVDETIKLAREVGDTEYADNLERLRPFLTGKDYRNNPRHTEALLNLAGKLREYQTAAESSETETTSDVPPHPSDHPHPNAGPEPKHEPTEEEIRAQRTSDNAKLTHELHNLINDRTVDLDGIPGVNARVIIRDFLYRSENMPLDHLTPEEYAQYERNIEGHRLYAEGRGESFDPIKAGAEALFSVVTEKIWDESQPRHYSSFGYPREPRLSSIKLGETIPENPKTEAVPTPEPTPQPEKAPEPPTQPVEPEPKSGATETPPTPPEAPSEQPSSPKKESQAAPKSRSTPVDVSEKPDSKAVRVVKGLLGMLGGSAAASIGAITKKIDVLNVDQLHAPGVFSQGVYALRISDGKFSTTLTVKAESPKAAAEKISKGYHKLRAAFKLM